MTKPIFYIDRISKNKLQEQVYGGSVLNFLYGNSLLCQVFGRPLAALTARLPFLSKFYGYLQNLPSSKRKVLPFIEDFNVDTTEFAAPADSYQSFNDFFTRKLKPSSRPIARSLDTAIIPADGRYLFYQNIDLCDGFLVKGKKFNLATLLKSESLAKKYASGAMVIARLCPTDYHRFHFPVDCTPSQTDEINGWLYSVNPIALKQNIDIFTENKRTLCTLHSKGFGDVLFLEIGATFVGAIHQTYTPEKPAEKGAEKGFFSFGGSSLILLFPPNTIQFDPDLLTASAEHLEIRCLMGQSMGKSV